MTTEQIEQKKQLLAEKIKQMEVIYDELVEAGAIELSEEDLDKTAGGFAPFYGVMDSFYKAMGKEYCPYHNPQALWTGDWKGKDKE